MCDVVILCPHRAPVQNVKDKLRYAALDTLLALTIFREDIGA